MTATATFVASAGNHAGTTSPASITLTWPGGLSAGDTALVISNVNNTSGLSGEPTGFTAVDGGLTVSTVLTSRAYTKTLVGNESGSLTVPSPTGFSGRMAAVMIIWRGADTSQTPTTAQTTTGATNQSIAAITPPTDAFVFAIGGFNVAQGTTGFSTPSGWTERQAQLTTNTTGNMVGAGLFTKDAAVTGGVSSGAQTLPLVGSTGRSSIWTFSVQNGTVAAIPGWQMGSIAMGH